MLLLDICKSINEGIYKDIKINKDSKMTNENGKYENSIKPSYLRNNKTVLIEEQNNLNISTPQLKGKIKRLFRGNKIVEKKLENDKLIKSNDSLFQFKPIKVSNHTFSLDFSKYSKRRSVLNNLNDNRFDIDLNDSINKIKGRKFT